MAQAHRKPQQHPIASLAEKATPETLAAASAQALRMPAEVTGQYLYDRFVVESREEVTKLAIVQQAADPNSGVSTESWKKALRDMVEIAKQTGSDAKLRTASNNQSVLRSLYGALKFAGERMQAGGFVAGKTGYQEARVIAKKALDDKGITWEGYPAKTPEQREQERMQKLQRKALQEVQDANPQQAGEDLGQYLERIRGLAEEHVNEAKQQAMADRIAKLAQQVINLCGDDLDAVLAVLPEVRESQADKAE